MPSGTDELYLDFELSIDARGGTQYEVATRSAAGDARETVTFPFDAMALERSIASAHRMWRIHGAAVSPSAPASRELGGANTEETGEEDFAADAEEGLRKLGTQLFNAVIVGRVAKRYQSLYDKARSSSKGLRVRLRIQAPEVATLPWEYLYDADHELFVARNTQTSVVRYVEVDEPTESLSVNFPLRILGVVSSPTDQHPLQKEVEQGRVESALGDLKQLGQVDLQWTTAGTYDAFSDALRNFEPHVVHYIGHGTQGAILLEQAEDKSTHEFPAQQLGELLVGYRSVRLVVLNSCEGARATGEKVFSSTAATVVRRGVAAVVAMQYPITDLAAVRFAHELYDGLAHSQPVDRAVSAARMTLHAAERKSPEWGTPVLFLQSVSGLLFSTGIHRTPEWIPPYIPPGFLQRLREQVRRVAIGLAGATVGVVGALALLLRPAPHMGITADLLTRTAAFHVDSAADLGLQFPVSSLLASGFDEVRLPIEPDTSLRRSVQLDPVPGTGGTPSATAQGTIEVLLGGVTLPARAELEVTADDGDYALELPPGIPDVGLTLTGAVRAQSDGRTLIHNYGSGERASLVSREGIDSARGSSIRFALPAEGDSVAVPMSPPPRVTSMRLFERVKQFGIGEPSARLETRLISGSVRDARGRELLTVSDSGHRDLRLEVDSGRIDRLVLTPDGIRVTFRGSVSRIGDGKEFSPSAMQSRLSLLSLPLRAVWLVAAALFGVLLAEGVGSVWRRLPRKKT